MYEFGKKMEFKGRFEREKVMPYILEVDGNVTEVAERY